MDLKEKDFPENKCEHKRRRTYKKKDKKMLCGYEEHDVCLDCKMKTFHVRMQVDIILNMIAKDLKIDRKKLSANKIFKQQGKFKYFSRKVNLKECKELILNSNKYI